MKGLPPLCERCEELLREHFRQRGAIFLRRDRPAPVHRQRAAPGGPADALANLEKLKPGICLDWPIPVGRDYDTFRSGLYKLARHRKMHIHVLRENRIVKLWIAATVQDHTGE